MIKGTFKKHLDESMKNPEFKKAWHELDTEFELLESMIKAREKAGLTQAELAQKKGLSSLHYQGLKEELSKKQR